MIETLNNGKLLEIMMKNDKKVEEEDIGSHLSDFEILQVLGEGSFGFVAKVKSKKNLKIYAMKKSDLSLINDQDLIKYYENESLFMKNLDHPNVCKLYTSFKEGDIVYMIMEFMDNGDLFTFLNAYMKLKEKISEEKLWNIFEQCIKGLVYIHSIGLIHRDIKPANLLINNKGEVKLSDFNVSALLNIEEARNFTNNSDIKEELVNNMTQVGSGSFQAPEVKQLEFSDSIYDDRIDIYSMGITFCTLAFFQTNLPNNAYKYYSKELVDIIKLMIIPNKNQRPNSKDLYNVFIKYYFEKYLHCTGLISCINCLSLYDSFTKYFLEEGDNIGPLNKISIQFNKILKALIQKKKNNFSINVNQEQEGFNYLLFEFRDLIYKFGIKKNADTNNDEIDPIYLINFLLNKLHGELNTKKVNLGLKGNYLKQFVTLENKKQEAYENYMIFYTSNFKSVISDNFFGLIKTKRICMNCNYLSYKFNMISFIPFNVKILVEYYPEKKNNLDIHDGLSKS